MATTYSTTKSIQDDLDIPAGDQGKESKYIDTLRDSAFAIINQMLRGYVTTPPLAATAEDYEVIVEAERLITEGLFRHRREEPRENTGSWGKALKKEGIQMVQDYIDNHFVKKEGRANMLSHSRSNPSWDQDMTV